MAKATTALKILNFIWCFVLFARATASSSRALINRRPWSAADIPFKPGNALRDCSLERAPGKKPSVGFASPEAVSSAILKQHESATSTACNRTGQTMKIGPFAFWVISPFGVVQLWTYYCVLNASGLPAIAVELSC
jgi:hypothetical protein